MSNATAALEHMDVHAWRPAFERLLQETNIHLLKHLDEKLDKQAVLLQHVVELLDGPSHEHFDNDTPTAHCTLSIGMHQATRLDPSVRTCLLS